MTTKAKSLVPQYRHLVRHSISHSTSVKQYGLRYIRYWISRKPLEIVAWFQRTPIGNGIMTIEWSRQNTQGHVT